MHARVLQLRFGFVRFVQQPGWNVRY
eukprot:COSAG03_NODE_26391_length_259_cov_0.968750_1_plen_25_part_10